ncbi:hypothetical protein JI666_20710 [Bacillus sp. NTK071]|uniref:HMA2 domain-containing protein n=1 Tax=Bacillus sp. NTK071 TaxID=2802175 RepID=UPI001A8DF797|nr:hypothetical protein [Bacillus sp. NTK071]MBN8211144.1 hypothetical protein [Bacillus sp. NTK071]
MLSKVKQALIMRRLEKMLSNYQINVMHYIPGRIRISSPYWTGNSKIIETLMPILKMEDKILSVRHTPETGTLLVEYDATPDVQSAQIEAWFELVQKVHNNVITKEVTHL